MIPKRIRKIIVVNGETWEYCVTGRWSRKVFLHNLKTNKKMDWYVEEAEGTAIKPSDIKELILTGKMLGVKGV